MLTNYLLIALRNVRRHSGYTILNILGLTLGVAATLFILLYITEELSFDRYHSKADRIFRVSSDITEPDNAFRWAVTQLPLAPQLRKDYPEVEEFVRFIPNGRTRLERGEQYFFEEKTFFVDSTLTSVFDFDFLKGDPKSALSQPLSMVLSESVAKKIFGDDNPIGESLKIDGEKVFKVTGVYRDMPKRSHLIANVMMSSNSLPEYRNPDPQMWGGFDFYTYVLLKEGTDPKSFAAKLPEVIEKYVAVIFDQYKIKIKYELIPVTEIHLTSTFEGEPEPVGKMAFLYIFGAVGLFLLLIASINYMNLATARSTRRAMEVGIRKVLGSERRQLIGQFITESVLFSVTALILSYLLVHLLLSVFNKAFDQSLGWELLYSTPVLLGAAGIVLLTGVLGGSYPAFYLSGFQPLTVLKGSLAKGSGNPQLRKVLVTVQFAITIFMLIGTGIIYDQMNYLRTKDLGFNKEQVLTFELSNQESRDKYPIIREKLLKNPNITAVGTATSSPGEGYGKNLLNIETAEGSMTQLGLNLYGVDYEYFPTLGMEFVAGRNFSREHPTDTSRAVLVNEAMVKRMSWKDPIGRKIQFLEDSVAPMLVIGVIKDFHQRSLYEPIEPLMFLYRENCSKVHARISSDIPATIAFAEQQWKDVYPNQPFEYDFVDASFMELYQADQVRARIFTLFSILMIVIACLGLLGLASYNAEQRTKEIGIRRVVGAGTGDIVLLLTRQFVLLTVVASLPAFFAGWYFMKKWLDTFAYHTPLNYWLFGLALAITVFVVLLTTGYHALKAVKGNLVDRLRWE